MDRWTPLDLTPYFNAGRDNAPLRPEGGPPWQEGFLESLRELPAGEQRFWGVPFQLGPAEGGRCWLVVGGGLEAHEVPITSQGGVRFTLFAHFCNTSLSLADRERFNPLSPEAPVSRPGEHLADYVLVYANGSEHRQPIRRRFEVNEPCPYWGHLAFTARPHPMDRPLTDETHLEMARDPNQSGVRGGWGWAQTGVLQGAYLEASRYWIYALENPWPERELKAIRLEAAGAEALAVAAITLYRGPGHPLRHRRLETLRVTLDPGAGAASESPSVAVDLGVVARVYQPLHFLPEAWLAAEPKGWGEAPSRPALGATHLVDLTAAEGAVLRLDGREVPLAEVYEKGKAESSDGGLRVELLTPQRTWLHVVVEDAATGRPTPVRAHFRTADGRYLPPYGHRREVNDRWFEDYGGDLKLGSTPYAYVDGRFQIELPVGECYVELSKGFEYRPLRVKLTVEPGQRELRLRLERAVDLRSQGWVTADTHVHFLSPQTAWLEAQAEGVNLVNLLASQWGDLFTNVGDLTGEASGVSRDDTIVWVGTENRQHLLGHISLLGVRGEPVFPMCASGPGESALGDPTWMSLAEWADRCREQEGVVVIPHFPNPYAEVVADLVLGKVDGVEIRDFYGPSLDTFGVTEWYRCLNLGQRVAAVGGTDKMSAGMPVGGVRTYAYLGDQPFSFESWGRAVRAGRTFTSSGPLLGLEVEGKSLGDEIRLPRGGGWLEARAWARSAFPFEVLQLVQDGRVIAEAHTDADQRQATLAAKVRVEGSGWLAARCLSPLKAWHVWPVHLAAHTSPVYVRVGEEPPFRASDAAHMLTLLEGGMAWLDTLSIPADPQRQAAIRATFEQAHQQLDRRLHPSEGGLER